jgi:hypothetical protein
MCIIQTTAVFEEREGCAVRKEGKDRERERERKGKEESGDRVVEPRSTYVLGDVSTIMKYCISNKISTQHSISDIKIWHS